MLPTRGKNPLLTNFQFRAALSCDHLMSKMVWLHSRVESFNSVTDLNLVEKTMLLVILVILLHRYVLHAAKQNFNLKIQSIHERPIAFFIFAA